MPVLAIPYVVPFANAAGIVIGSVATAVGLSALSDKVQDYMEENPENSMKILAMIMPEQGIAALFNKEAGDEVEGEGEEVEEEVEVKDTRTKKEIVLDAVRKARRGRGNYSSPDAEGPAVSGRGSVIRGLEDAGKVDKGLSKKPYKKSKFNWKRFTRNKADGGRIGFEVGGLSSRAQSIYDSWIAAGHTEEDVLAYLTAQGLYDVGTDTETVESIVGADITEGGEGGNDVDVRSYIPLSERNKITDEDDIGFLEGLKNKIGSAWSGISSLNPLRAMAMLRNPFNPNSPNYNPMLRSQKDFALRPTDMKGLGFQQDDAGRFLGSADPWSDEYNPLLGLNLVSGFGSNDLLTMLKKRRDKLTGYDYTSDSKTEKLNKINQMINQAGADETQVKFGTLAHQFHPSQGGNQQGGYSHPGSTKSREMSDPFNEGGLATMFQRRR